MTDSNSENREIDLLFEGMNFIPQEILDAVKKTLFAERRRHKFGHETLRDLIQTCLMKVWEKEGKFSSEPPEYFGRIVKNTVIDYCRQRAKMSRFTTPSDEEDFSTHETDIMNDALCQTYSKSELDDLIQTVLDDDEAAVICLRFFEGLSFDQISIRLNMTLSMVKRRRSDAVLKLRSSLRPVAFPLNERLGVNENTTS